MARLKSCPFAKRNTVEAFILKLKQLLAAPLRQTAMALMAAAMMTTSALGQEARLPVRAVINPAW